MNYIKLLNQFWKHRRGKRLSSITADLYYFLIQECNQQEWTNPFECTNVLIFSSINISESALIDARNKLKQVGLIDFQSGKRNEKAPVYTIFYPVQNGKDPGKQDGKDPGKQDGKDPGIINKPNDKPKPKHSEGKPSGAAKPSSKKKKSEDVTPHWEAMVEVWFKFYVENPGKGEKPTFEGQAPKSLKKICEWLQKRSEAKNLEWTEEKATDTLQLFLIYAYKQDWLNTNFLLQNLERQFDKIVNQNAASTKNGKQPTGSGVNVSSALAKISQLPD